jgi:hypothetical protein
MGEEAVSRIQVETKGLRITFYSLDRRDFEMGEEAVSRRAVCERARSDRPSRTYVRRGRERGRKPQNDILCTAEGLGAHGRPLSRTPARPA